jgi:DNA polymerase-3 subunit alpha
VTLEAVDLHLHTTFSYGDGFGTPEQHIARQAELGRSAAFVTEHGNVSSHPQWEKAGKKYGVKTGFGLEAYTALDPKDQRKYHLTILAANQTGYMNLMQLVGQSYRNFYYYPTISGADLARWNEGLIITSGCADSLLACSLLGGKTIEPADASWKRAKRQASAFKELLGDRFYLETQAFPELPRSIAINEAYERLGKKLGIRLAATQDVHYPQPDDNEMQVILHAAMRGASSVAQQEAGWEYGIRLTPAITPQMYLGRLETAGLSPMAAAEALASTVEIAGRTDVTLPKAGRLRYPLEGLAGRTAVEEIWSWLRDGWRYRVQRGNNLIWRESAKYHERLRYEMDLITAKDFVDYFLMIADIVQWAKNNGIPVGPARGSAASSLVCYLLRITEIDPLQYPLMYFERFIALDRTDVPDIDLDFDSSRRHEVREYAVGKYGEARVGNVANYVRYKGKNALEDVGRVFPHIPKADVNVVKSLIIERSGGDSRSDQALGDTLGMFPAAEAVMQKWPDLRKAVRLEGNMRGMSVHAAGLVISETPIADTCALYTRTKKVDGVDVTTTVVSVDKKDLEYVGLMKVDLLGLSTMTMIRDCLEMAGLTLEDLYAIAMTDRRTMQAFRDNDVIGIFQFEGRATRLVNRQVRPDNFQELADINGLSRPGPLFSGTTSDYITIKHGEKRQENVHPLWDEFTNFTKGQIIYQEQVLKALADIGGLSVTRVHEIRRIISQKLGEAQFNTSAEDWIAGAERIHGIKRDLGKFMWGRLVTSATYSFNIAHCVSYSMLAFWCMWLKVHYPVEFYAAQLRQVGGKDLRDKEANQRTLIKDAERHGISVLGAGPGSAMTWKADRAAKSVRAGWTQMPGIGDAIGARIIAYERDIIPALGREMTMDDLPNVSGIGPNIMLKISETDSADPFGLRKVESQLKVIRQAIDSGALDLPSPTHNSDGLLDAHGDARVIWLGFPREKQYKDFVEDERARSGKDVAEILRSMNKPSLKTSVVLRCYDDGDEDVYLRVSRYDFPRHRAKLEALGLNGDAVLVIGTKSSSTAFGINIRVQRLIVIEPD